MSIEYAPNGNETYKKEHQVIVRAIENGERVKSIKYQWLESTEKPEKETFTEELTNGEQITKNEITGTWYLWTLLETESGSYSIQRSDAFNFDNKGPNVTLTSTPISATSFTLNAEASDEHIGGELRYEFYIGGVSQNNTPTAKSYTKNYISTGYSNCSVKVYDSLNNVTEVSTSARTMLYKWNYYNYTTKTSGYKEVEAVSGIIAYYRIDYNNDGSLGDGMVVYMKHSFNENFGYSPDMNSGGMWFNGGSNCLGYYTYAQRMVDEQGNKLQPGALRIDKMIESKGGYSKYSCTYWKNTLKEINEKQGNPIKTITSTSKSAHTSGTIEDGYLVEYAGLT